MTMTFLEPALLWGALAVAVPIALHFWHQKRGQPLPWATLRWLTDPNQQPNRGLKVDNLLLLALRCAVLPALAGLLARPVFTETNAKPIVKKVHLVENNALITNSFRFELETAKQQNEPISLLETVSWSPLQSTINRLNRPDHELHLYLTNRQRLANDPPVVVPSRFQLHTAVPTTKSNQPVPRYTKPMSVRLTYRNPVEKQTVRAGLQALADVYGFVFTEQTAATARQEPDLVLTDKPVSNPSASTFYIVSQKTAYATAPNVVFRPDTLTVPTSELVANGQLPEWLGGQIGRHLGLINNDLPVSSAQLNAAFIRADNSPEQPAPQTGQAIWTLGLIGLITAERWLSFRKNA